MPAQPSGPTAVIRQAGSGDIAALSALARLTYAAAFGASMSDSDLATILHQTRSEAAFHKALVADTLLIAHIGDEMVGYVQICDLSLPVKHALPADQQIEALYVQPDLQGQGIGRQLLEAALDLSRLRTAPHIYLDVWEENDHAVALYKRFGFEKFGTVHVKAGDRVIGEDLIMVRRNPLIE